MKALVVVGALNQEKALVGAFYVIVKTGCGTDGALHSTTAHNLQTGKHVSRADSRQWHGELNLTWSRCYQMHAAEGSPLLIISPISVSARAENEGTPQGL